VTPIWLLQFLIALLGLVLALLNLTGTMYG
jgi:hypothetical protein